MFLLLHGWFSFFSSVFDISWSLTEGVTVASCKVSFLNFFSIFLLLLPVKLAPSPSFFSGSTRKLKHGKKRIEAEHAFILVIYEVGEVFEGGSRSRRDYQLGLSVSLKIGER